MKIKVGDVLVLRSPAGESLFSASELPTAESMAKDKAKQYGRASLTVWTGSKRGPKSTRFRAWLHSRYGNA